MNTDKKLKASSYSVCKELNKNIFSNSLISQILKIKGVQHLHSLYIFVQIISKMQAN